MVETLRVWLRQRLGTVQPVPAIINASIGQGFLMVAGLVGATFLTWWADPNVTRAGVVIFFLCVLLALAVATLLFAMAWRWIFPLPVAQSGELQAWLQNVKRLAEEQHATSPLRNEGRQPSGPALPSQHLRVYSPEEVAQKLKVISAALEIVRDRMQPTARQGELLLEKAWAAFKEPERFPHYWDEMVEYCNTLRKNAKDLESLRDSKQEHARDLASTAGDQPKQMASKFEGFTDVYRNLTWLKSDVPSNVFGSLIGKGTGPFQEATRNFVVWRNNAERALVEIHRKLSP